VSDDIPERPRCGNCNVLLYEEFFNWFWYNEVVFPERQAFRIAAEWTKYEAEWREAGSPPNYYSNQALAEMANESQKLGLYEDFDTGEEESE
jgi:hypothetical protein